MERKATTQPNRGRAWGGLRRACGGLVHLFTAAAAALLTGAALALGQTPATLAYQSQQTPAAPAGEIRRIAIVLAPEPRGLFPPLPPPGVRPAHDRVPRARP